jgi:hypothetical protein
VRRRRSPKPRPPRHRGHDDRVFRPVLGSLSSLFALGTWARVGPA